MRGIRAFLFALVLLPACQKTVYRSSEGQYCSTNEGDDPYYQCLRSYDLVCINTYSIPVINDAGGQPRYQEVHLCRLACTPAQGCPVTTDVCCPGPIYGRNYGAMAACVPPDRCERLPEVDAGPRPDRAPTSDTASADMATADAPRDAGAPDAAVDAAAAADSSTEG